jgi:hypothetical protein
MNVTARSLLWGLGLGLVTLSSAVAQKVPIRSAWLGDTSQAISSSLARVLAEVARDFHTGRPIYLVATLKPPHYVTGRYDSQTEAETAARAATAAGDTSGAFGPFETPLDIVRQGAASIDSVVIYTRAPSGAQRITLTMGDDVDALFLTPAAIDKFLIPYYAQLYGPDVAAQYRTNILAGVPPGTCHKYTRACTIAPDLPMVPLEMPQ